MMCSEDMVVHEIFGKAALNFTVGVEEITDETLIINLKAMMKAEKCSGSRSQRISNAIGWLQDIRVVSMREIVTIVWMLHDTGQRVTAGYATSASWLRVTMK